MPSWHWHNYLKCLVHTFLKLSMFLFERKMQDLSILLLSFFIMTGCFNTSVLSMVSFIDIFVQPHTVASCNEECRFSAFFGLWVCSLLYLSSSLWKVAGAWKKNHQCLFIFSHTSEREMSVFQWNHSECWKSKFILMRIQL